MRRVAFILIIIVLISLFTGCGAKQKMEEKVAEKIIEKTLGGNVDIDGEEVTIKTEEGNVTFGNTEWPTSELSSKVPEFKKGKIVSVVNSEAYFMVIIEEVEVDDFMDYYEKVKGEFNQESYETKSEDTIAYMGKNNEEISIIISYSLNDNTASITSSLPEKE